MIAIDNLNKKLQIKLAGAVTTNQLNWNLSYVGEPVWGATDGLTNDTTLVDMVLGAQGVPNTPVYGIRKVATISVFNGDTAAATPQIIYYNGTSGAVIINALLQPNYTLHYESEKGWYVTDDMGLPIETVISVTGITIGDNVNGSVAGKYLYVDGAFTLRQGYFTHTGTGVEVDNGKFISSSGGAMQIDFGGGAYLQLSTDAGALAQSYIFLNATTAQIARPDGQILINAAELLVGHSTLILFDSPAYRFNQLTASTVPYLNASKNLVSSAVTPTQLGYLDATSSIQTQLNTKEAVANKDTTNGYVGLAAWKINFRNLADTFTSFLTNTASAARTYLFPDKDITVAGIDDVYFSLVMIPQALSPADATTYYFTTGIAPTTTAANHQLAMPTDCAVIGAIISVAQNGTSGSTENNTLKFNNITTATQTNISTTFKSNGSTTAIVSSTVAAGAVSIPVTAGDLFTLQWDTPTYATNPVGAVLRVTLILKRT